MIHEHNKKKQNSKKLQQDNSELWKLVSLKTYEDWKNQQDFYNVKKVEVHHSHACFECIIQTNNNDKNTEYNFQLY